MESMSRYFKRLQFYTRAGPSFVLLALLGRFHTARLFVRWLSRICRPQATQQDFCASLLDRVEPELAAESLKKDGVFAGLRLRDSVLLELRETLMAQICYGAGQLDFPFPYGEKQDAERRYGQKFLQAHYYDLPQNSALVECLANDPLLKQIGRGYFGTEPVLVGTRAWWSFACGASAEQRVTAGQSFHYDVDDYLAMSVFFYLTDVDTSSGPHVTVRGSHRKRRMRDIWSPARTRSDEAVLGTYGAERLLTLCGPAGFGFLEDAFCFHKALHPETRDRLVIQVRYALHDYGVGSDETHRAWLADTYK